MSLQIINDQPEMFNAVIKVIGVGGGGGNAVEHMIDNEARGITFIAANTDQQALNRSRADIIIPLGKTGLGAGARPEVGAMAAQEASEKIREALEGTNLLFITAGMGGGTGTGAAPVIAEIAKQLGILTIAVVTKPFGFEGMRRMRQAQAGIENLKDKVDSLIVILNDKLEEEVGEDATMLDCFAAADDVLYKACNGIAEIIHTPGLINVDFEDLKTVMGARGTAMMGTATAAGDHRAHCGWHVRKQCVPVPDHGDPVRRGARESRDHRPAESLFHGRRHRKVRQDRVFGRVSLPRGRAHVSRKALWPRRAA